MRTSHAELIDRPHYVDFRHAPPRRWTPICRPGDRHQTLVSETGALFYGHEPEDPARPARRAKGRFRGIVRFGVASNEPPIAVEQFTDDPRVPIVTTVLRYRTCTLDLRAGGHRDAFGRRVDVVRWRLSAEHEEPGIREAVRIGILGDGEPLMLADTALVPDDAAGLGRGSIMRTADSCVSAKRAANGSIALFLDGPSIEGHHLDPGWADEAFGLERRFWAGIQLSTIELRVPDRGIMDLLSASARTLIQAREAPASTLDAHLLTEAARYLGHADQARERLEAALQRTQPDRPGPIASLEETAICIAMMVRQQEVSGTPELTPRDAAFLRHALIRMAELRGQSGEYGAPSASGHGRPGGEREELAARLWALTAVSMVARCHGVPRALQLMAARIKTALRARSGRRVWRDLQLANGGGTSRSVLGLTQAIYPGEAFAPDDPLVSRLCTLLEAADDEEGIPSDNARLIPHAASFYADIWLYAGRPDKAIDYLYAFADHAAPTGVWAYAAGAAAFVRLVRNLLVFERGDQLELLEAVPSNWLHPGAEIVVQRTPTRFGPVSVHVSVDAANEVHLTLEADWVRPPRRIAIRPPAATIRVRVDGRLIDGREECLMLRPASKMTAAFARAQRREPVVGHAATKAALRAWTVFSSAYPFKPDIRAYRQYPLESDGPAHDEYRAILAPWFHRRRIEELEPRIRAVATDVIAGLASAGRAEAVHELALPMVVRSLGVTLGRPQDVDEWLSWGVEINIVHGRRDGRGTDAYLGRVFDEVGLQPGDDIFSHIATSTLSGRPLTQRDRFGLCSMVLTAGRAAVVNLLSGAIWVLASRPSEQARLAAHPALVPTAMEEMLRYLSPAPEMDRTLLSDIDGFPAGSQVVLSFVSANHDPSVFHDPGRIDLSRRPNHHLAFGNGPHTCLGAHLGKLEARVLLEELLRIVPHFEHDGEPEISWQRVGDTDVPRDFMSVPIRVVQ
ncbi:hypothetical protein BH18CHL1_BH18CHL1_01840 [soil metagenome]